MISLRHITKKFGQLKAVSDASLEVEKGEIICLIGPSGSGKSTFLRCINGLEAVSYTHLDVYKRQALQHTRRALQPRSHRAGRLPGAQHPPKSG